MVVFTNASAVGHSQYRLEGFTALPNPPQTTFPTVSYRHQTQTQLHQYKYYHRLLKRYKSINSIDIIIEETLEKCHFFWSHTCVFQDFPFHIHEMIRSREAVDRLL